MGVKALAFDIIGTVFDWYDSFSSRVPPLAHEYGLTLDGATFATGAADGYASGVATVQATGVWTPPDTILQTSIASLLGHAPPAAQVDPFFEIWRTLAAWPDVAGALYALQGHYTLAILSNMSVVTQSSLQCYAGLPFERTLSAATVQRYKPNPAVYQMAMASLGLVANEIMLVAAHGYDLAAAGSLGFRTAYVARSTEGGTPSAAFTINATSFTELAASLGAGAPTLREDCLPVSPRAAQAQLRGGQWTVVDGNALLFDFGASQASAERAAAVIAHYGFDRVCFVGRPNPPMTYFTVGGKAPTGALAGEDAVTFNLAQLRAQASSGSWIVTDGASRLLDFGTSQANALHAVALIRNYGFTHQCFVGRPNAPMMYFRQ
jgi:2-haloalkanoic acid dehalogenase type II